MSVIPAQYMKPPPVIKNRDWRLSLYFRNSSDQSRIDITSYTLACEFRYANDLASPTATATVTVTNAAQGEFNILLSDTLADGLDYATYKAINFSLKVTEPNGDIVDYLYGICEMKQSATE